MVVTFLSSYPPRSCGLATFTHSLRRHVAQQDQIVDTRVVAMTRGPHAASYDPDEVQYQIRDEVLSDYHHAADYLNHSGTDVLNIQHEFGIFGGQGGLYLAELLNRYDGSAIATLHTVLPDPDPYVYQAMQQLSGCVDQFVVMTPTASTLLHRVYGINPRRVHVIPHGAPDVPFEDTTCYKGALGLDGRTVLLTFGLLSPNKGIEFMLDALPEVAAEHPEALYIVLGATHPEIKNRDGESYRAELQQRVADRGLEDNVRFVDRYVDDDTLQRYLLGADLYVTPYPGMQQICSGTLAYAVGTGRAIVSTPYLHARDVLADGRGTLVDYGDTAALRDTLLHLVGNAEVRYELRRRTYEHGRSMTWPAVGRQYAKTYAALRTWQRCQTIITSEFDLPSGELQPRLDHLRRLTDDTGIFQHASYGIPCRQHGYCTDDAGRALVATLEYYLRHEDPQALRLARIYLSFLLDAQREDGSFHNFMSFRRTFLTSDVESEDTLGRALWGLGATVALFPQPGPRLLAREMVERTLHLPLRHPQAIAYALSGYAYVLEAFPGHEPIRTRLTALADQLVAMLETHRDDTWVWFCDELTYGNALIPASLLRTGALTGVAQYRRLGQETLDFLLKHTYASGQFDFIGCHGWGRRHAETACYDQQPVEAGYTAWACATAWDVLGQSRYRALTYAAVEWYFGRNRAGLRLYDSSSGACFDGLTVTGYNYNQGAESAIAVLLGLLALERLRPASSHPPMAQDAAPRLSRRAIGHAGGVASPASG